MKNNFKIINFLRRLFYVLFMFSILNLVAGTMMNLIALFFPEFPMGELSNIHFFSSATFEANTSYALLGGDVFNGKSDVVLYLNEIHSDQFIYRFIGFVDTTLIMLFSFFLFKNAHELFSNLTTSFKTGESFSHDSYKNIRTVGFWLLGFWIYSIINGFVFSFVLLKDVVVQGLQLNFYPDLSEFSGLIVVLVIFVFAEVYRSGIVMQEEAEYTI